MWRNGGGRAKKKRGKFGRKKEKCQKRQAWKKGEGGKRGGGVGRQAGANGELSWRRTTVCVVRARKRECVCVFFVCVCVFFFWACFRGTTNTNHSSSL